MHLSMCMSFSNYYHASKRSLGFHYITLIQKITATTLLRLRWMGGQQQPVDDFASRVNLKRLFKDGAILSGDSEKVKGAASQYFCWGEAHAWVYQTSWGTASCICDRREFRIVLLEFQIQGGGIKNLKTGRGASKIYQ